MFGRTTTYVFLIFAQGKNALVCGEIELYHKLYRLKRVPAGAFDSFTHVITEYDARNVDLGWDVAGLNIAFGAA